MAAIRTGPTIKRGKSRQDIETPGNFLEAVRERFGEIRWDLAATKENRVTPQLFIPPEQNSLDQDWNNLVGLLWLNPPYANIRPWAAKCETVRHRPGWTLLLVPAAVGSEWYADHVHGKAYVLALRPRIVFVGETQGYPRDLILAAYGFGVSGFETWRWDR